MLFSNILLLAGIAAALPEPIEEDSTLEARAPGGIKLIKLKVSKKSTFTGFGFPGQCNRLPSNIKTFIESSSDTKSVLSCFECTVYTGHDCSGTSVTLEGQKAFKIHGHPKPPTYRSWKCECKDSC